MLLINIGLVLLIEVLILLEGRIEGKHHMQGLYQRVWQA